TSGGCRRSASCPSCFSIVGGRWAQCGPCLLTAPVSSGPPSAFVVAQAFLFPAPQQAVARLRVAAPGALQGAHPVGPEMAEVATQLAPGRDQAPVLEEGHGEGPYQALSAATLG